MKYLTTLLTLSKLGLSNFKRVKRPFTFISWEQKYFTAQFCTVNDCDLRFDFNYLCDESNTQEIKDNIKGRKEVGDIDKVINLWKDFHNEAYNAEEKDRIKNELNVASRLIPNKASPHVLSFGDNPKIIKYVNEKPTFQYKPAEFESLAKKHHMLKCGDRRLSAFMSPESYYFSGALADMEQALIRYTVSSLIKKGFTLISVPDLLYDYVFESCGMETKDATRSKVFHLANFHEPKVCLSGTAEMAIGGFLQNRNFQLNELPLKIASVSRCYRKEKHGNTTERGIYRVHAFTKVEMFGVTANETGDESTELFRQLVDTQIELFTPLGFHFMVLDMPLCDLGAPAYTKLDIEAWMPVQRIYGEISSASNCTDFQSRLLNIQYRGTDGNQKYAHTVNGTACAIPRTLMTIIASNQQPKGFINIPPVLQEYMGGQDTIKPSGNPLPVNPISGNSYDGVIVNREEYNHILQDKK